MSLDPTTLQAGDQIPVWERAGTFDHWNRFAAVNDEFAGHHMDDEVGRHEGFDAAFIMAPLSHAYLHAMLREWLDDQGRIVSIEMRLRSPLLRGRTLRAGGQVTAVRHEAGEIVVDLDVWEADDQDVRLSAGPATVAFPA